MEKFRLFEIKALIADSTEISAQTTRNLLKNHGMSNISLTMDLEQTRREIVNHDFDLLVINSHLNDIDIAPLLHDIRQGDIGDNPFIPIIALAWEPSVETVGRMINGGVDVLLTLPLSAVKMDKALEQLVVRRKPFVVTAEYIGPDRRKKLRPESNDAPMTVVPNPLKRKALGIDEVGPPEEILRTIFDQRVESYISRITFSVGKISGLIGDAEKGTMSGWLEELRFIAKQLSLRIKDTRYAHQGALCHSLIDVLEDIPDGQSPNAQEMELLQQIALALEIAVKQDDATTVNAALNIEKMIENTLGGDNIV